MPARMGVPLGVESMAVSGVPVLPMPQAAKLAVATTTAIRAAVTLRWLIGLSFLAPKRARAARRAGPRTRRVSRCHGGLRADGCHRAGRAGRQHLDKVGAA